MPKLQSFDENRDDMDAFIQRFESSAMSLWWPRDRWTIQLSALLQGIALDVYHRQPVSEEDNYGWRKHCCVDFSWQRRDLEKSYVQKDLRRASHLVCLWHALRILYLLHRFRSHREVVRWFERCIVTWTSYECSIEKSEDINKGTST